MLNYPKYHNMNCFSPDLQEQCRCVVEKHSLHPSDFSAGYTSIEFWGCSSHHASEKKTRLVERRSLYVVLLLTTPALLTDGVFLGDLKLNGGKMEKGNAFSRFRFC